MIRTNLYVLILISFHLLPFTEFVHLMVRLCARHVYPPSPQGRGIAGFFLLLNFQSPAKSPALRGQICGKIPAKCPRPLVDNNDYQQMT